MGPHQNDHRKILAQTFQITLRHQLSSIKEGVILLAFTPIGLAFCHWIGKITWDDYPGILIILFLYNLVLFLPAFYLHLNYYVDNRNILLKVDPNSKRFSVKEKDSISNFPFSDIHLVEQHLGIYYKNKIDRRGRWTLPWSGYGYLKVELRNGRTYFFSSLMLNAEIPPLPISKTVYRFFPVIRRRTMSVLEKENRKVVERQEKFNNYLEQFGKLSREALQEKVDNEKRYEPEAVAAARKLLGDEKIEPKENKTTAVRFNKQ